MSGSRCIVMSGLTAGEHSCNNRSTVLETIRAGVTLLHAQKWASKAATELQHALE